MFVSEPTLRLREAYSEFALERRAGFLPAHVRGRENSVITILLVILILMLVGAVPNWSHSRNWGYGPSGGLGLVVLILVILLLSGRL